MRPIPPQERVCANRQLALLGAYDPANRLCDMKDILEAFCLLDSIHDDPLFRPVSSPAVRPC
jgi:hypothetical protein